MHLYIRRHAGGGIPTPMAAKVRCWKHEFICHGEAAESPYHEWECSFYLAWNREKTHYALVLLDWGDASDGRGDDARRDEIPVGEVVGLMIDPPSCDENWIARYLPAEYWNAGGRYIEFFHRVGRFAIEDKQGQRLRQVEDPRQLKLPL